MKCETCGAAVTLQDEFCPYCGALNKPARKHIEDMKRYQKSFETTRDDVLKNSASQSRKHAHILIVALLIAANILCIVGHMVSSELRYAYRDFQTQRNASQYEAEIAVLEETGDYATLYSLYSYRNLYQVTSIREYDAVASYARYWKSIFDCVYYIEHPETTTYYTQGETIQRLAERIHNFYEYRNDMEREYYKDRFTESHLAAIQNMDEQIQTLMKTTFELTDEETEQLAQMETQELIYMLGKKVGYYE